MREEKLKKDIKKQKDFEKHKLLENMALEKKRAKKKKKRLNKKLKKKQAKLAQKINAFSSNGNFVEQFMKKNHSKEKDQSRQIGQKSDPRGNSEEGKTEKIKNVENQAPEELQKAKYELNTQSLTSSQS